MKEIRFAQMVKHYRKQSGLTMKQLATAMGKTESAVSRWESGENSPKMEDIHALAKFFNVEMDNLVYGATDDTLSKITVTSSKLHEPRQKRVLTFATDQLDRQNKEKAPSNLTKLSEVREVAPDYAVSASKRARGKLSADALTAVEVTERASAGFGFHYDGNEKTTYYTLRTDLPRFDFATLVSGDSMEPTLHDGDVILVRQSYDTPRGGIYVVDYDGTAWVKHVHMEDAELVLHSENAKYSDRLLPIPPEDGEYWQIVGEVVDWFTPEII